MNKSCISITNAFRTIPLEGPRSRSEGRTPEKLSVDRGSEFKTFKSLLNEYDIDIYSTYIDLQAVFKEQFCQRVLHIINKPMFSNGACNWVNLLNERYHNNIHSTINMSSTDASNHSEKVILNIMGKTP